MAAATELQICVCVFFVACQLRACRGRRRLKPFEEVPAWRAHSAADRLPWAAVERSAARVSAPRVAATQHGAGTGHTRANTSGDATREDGQSRARCKQQSCRGAEPAARPPSRSMSPQRRRRKADGRVRRAARRPCLSVGPGPHSHPPWSPSRPRSWCMQHALAYSASRTRSSGSMV